MSDPTKPTTTDWPAIIQDVSTVVSVLSPIAAMTSPGLSAAVTLGTKIIQGVIDAEPTAIALYDQIKNGTPPTAQQLSQFAANYEAAYQQLNADINAKLATLP